MRRIFGDKPGSSLRLALHALVEKAVDELPDSERIALAITLLEGADMVVVPATLMLCLVGDRDIVVTPAVKEG